MRNPDRIVKFCLRFAHFWRGYAPDLRFKQVLDLIYSYGNNTDPFYWEESDWLTAIDNATRAMENKEPLS